MLRYERPSLRALGRMDVVTRKSGSFPDVDEAGQPDEPPFPFLCAITGLPFFCGQSGGLNTPTNGGSGSF